MQILNYTTWATEDVQALITAVLEEVGLTPDPAQRIVVRTGSKSAWWAQGRLEFRLPATGQATPLELLACECAFSPTEIRALIALLVKQLPYFKNVDAFRVGRLATQLHTGDLPAWTKHLRFRKRLPHTKERAEDQLAGLRNDVATVTHAIDMTKQEFEKKLASLEAKRAKLVKSLERAERVAGAALQVQVQPAEGKAEGAGVPGS